ncbi:hypothetical protein Ahy_A06g029141 isoform A [Arachis hypogaea]|uniref:Uncharacterized protein n=1 Tax=Arachis hypogaea TaxID=3818 RepID=A0A445CSN1_ARAHY|nr:hypothetical protein Ahy_A06g029141 isoform A [Arachis hypogaea]
MQPPNIYHQRQQTESVAKEHEERIARKATQEQEDIPLFYSDIMPLLVTNEASVGEDAFVWMGSQFPLVADVANGRFTFETLTAPTGLRLHHPAYDIFLKNMDKCIQHLQNQTKPNGVELADDEYILHVEGTASSQRVVRHIGTTSWPGRLTLTNYALYFEASGIINYEDAIKMDLSKDVEQSVKPAATGPWGAQLFDKAIIYESSDSSEEIVLEFPELTSSTRREHWLALIREIMFLHQFLSKYNINGPIQAWEIHARTILGIIRLHAAREMLRISPPVPTKFLIFSLYNELPKGDYVLEEFADSLKKVNSGHSCSASSILRIMNMYRSIPSDEIVEKPIQEVESSTSALEDSPSLKTAIKQSRKEEKEVLIAKATTEELKDDGVIDSIMELLKPLKHVVPWVQGIFAWERPINTVAVLVLSLIITYMEWVGKAIACFLIWVIVKMLEARKNRICEKRKEIVISRTSMASDQSTVESIVSAQHGLYTVHEIMQIANIAMLKIWSILIYKADKKQKLDQRREKRKTNKMSGIMHKIEETLHMGGNKKDQEHKGESHGSDQYKQGEHHQQQQHYGGGGVGVGGEHHGSGGVYGGEHGHVQEHHPGEQQHKEGLVDKIKDKIHGGDGAEGEKKKKKDKKKGEHGHDHGHDSSSSSDICLF